MSVPSHFPLVATPEGDRGPVDILAQRDAQYARDLQKIGSAIGYGNAQHILGELWDQMLAHEYGAGPGRGAMGVTVDDLLPPLPKPRSLRRQMQPHGGYQMVPAYSAAEMKAFAHASIANAAGCLREGSNPKGERPPGPSAEHEEPGPKDAPKNDSPPAEQAAREVSEPPVLARTLLTLLWRKYDAAGISMGRSYESVLLEAAMDLLGPPDVDQVARLDKDSAEVVDEVRTLLSNRRAAREGLAQASAHPAATFVMARDEAAAADFEAWQAQFPEPAAPQPASAQVAEPVAWQPIETAPASGAVLLAVAHGEDRRTMLAEQSHEQAGTFWYVTHGWTGWSRLHGAWTPVAWARLPTYTAAHQDSHTSGVRA